MDGREIREGLDQHLQNKGNGHDCSTKFSREAAFSLKKCSIYSVRFVLVRRNKILWGSYGLSHQIHAQKEESSDTLHLMTFKFSLKPMNLKLQCTSSLGSINQGSLIRCGFVLKAFYVYIKSLLFLSNAMGSVLPKPV